MSLQKVAIARSDDRLRSLRLKKREHGDIQMAVKYPDKMKCLNIGDARPKGEFREVLRRLAELSANESAKTITLSTVHGPFSCDRQIDIPGCVLLCGCL
jgi:hypothetical protein